MAFSGQLGGSLSILGNSFALGFAEVGDQTNQNVSNSFGWNSVAVFDPIITRSISQSLFNGTDFVEALYRVASNTFFVDIASPDVTLNVKQFLGLTERKIVTVGNLFAFKSVATIAVVANAANFWFTNLSEQNKAIQAHNVSNSFGWVDVISTVSEANAENTFGFVNVGTFEGLILDQDVTQDGGGFLRQTVSFSIDENRCRELEYNPNIGSTDDDTYDKFRVTKPVFDTGTVTFTYPPISPTNTLTLDDPDFNNSDTLTFTRIDRETRGGDRKIFSDGKWTSWGRLEMTVSDLHEVDADEIIVFLNASLGRTVRLTDWEGRTWEGFIVEPDTDLVKSRGGWRLDLVFEAEITDRVVEHNERPVTHNVNAGDDVNVTHDAL